MATTRATPATSDANTSHDREPQTTPSESESTATDAGADTFGAGCSAIPTDGKGSFDGMVTDPVATAASNNPLLKTLVAAVTEADLVDTLNSAPALTVFAPTDDAFEQDPEEGPRRGSRRQADPCKKILTHHVVEGSARPGRDREAPTTHLAGDTITVEGDLPELTVNESHHHLRQHPDGERDGLRDRHRHDAEDVTFPPMRKD